jgi:hypothetical protein
MEVVCGNGTESEKLKLNNTKVNQFTFRHFLFLTLADHFNVEYWNLCAITFGSFFFFFETTLKFPFMVLLDVSNVSKGCEF